MSEANATTPLAWFYACLRLEKHIELPLIFAFHVLLRNITGTDGHADSGARTVLDIVPNSRFMPH